MPSGDRQVFRITIYPDSTQKKKLSTLEKEASTLFRAVERDLISQYNTVKLFHSEQEVLRIVLANRKHFGIQLLNDYSMNSIARQAYMKFLDRVSESDNQDIKIGRQSSRPDIEFETGDVIFAISELIVRIPYIGNVRHGKNQFIVGKSFEKVQRIFLKVVSQVYCLVVDCTEPEISFGGPMLSR